MEENIKLEETKVQIAKEIAAVREKMRLTTVEFMEMSGLNQSDCSNLMNGKLEKFAIQRLFKVAIRMGLTISVEVDA